MRHEVPLVEELYDHIVELFVEDGRKSAIEILDLTCPLVRQAAIKISGEEVVQELRDKAREFGQTPILWRPADPESFAGQQFDGEDLTGLIVQYLNRQQIPVLLHDENGTLLTWVTEEI